MAAIRRPQLPQALARWSDDLRLLLLAGPDASATDEALHRAVAALADAADPLAIVDLAADELKRDPGRLADEAAAISMFGGRRLVRVTGAGEQVREAVALLLEAPVAGNPVVVAAGDLSRQSALRKLAEGSARALLLLSYPLEGRALLSWLKAEAQKRGLALAPGVDGRLVAATEGDLGILQRELDKFQLYLDAAPEAPRTLDDEALAALLAGSGEENTGALVAAVVADDRDEIEQRLRLMESGSAIPALRAIHRRLLQLAEARALCRSGMEAKEAVRALRPPVYPFAEQDRMARALARWPEKRIYRAMASMLAGERAIKKAGSVGDVVGWEAIAALSAWPAVSAWPVARRQTG